MIRNRLAVLLAAVSLASSGALAAPMLSLTSTNGAASTSVTKGTATLSLALRGDTGSDPVSGLFFHLTAPSPIVYGATPVTAGTPFPAADAGPIAGAAVDASQVTSFFKSGPGDYPALAAGATLATFQFSIASLGVGSYVFTPVGEGLTNSAGLATTEFASPLGFTLYLTAIPEPALTAALAGIAIVLRRRRK